MNIDKTSFIFLRHGEPVGGKIFRGSTDDPLTDNGWLQMDKAIKDLSFDQIVSSPLKRCLDFSEKIQQLTSTTLTVMDDLQELDLGVWEGLSVEEVAKLDSNGLKTFWAMPYSYTPENGEMFQAFEKRIHSSWQALNEQFPPQTESKTVLVVCHAGVMMVLLKMLLNIPVENLLCIKLNYASKVRVEVFDKTIGSKPQIYIDHGYSF